MQLTTRRRHIISGLCALVLLGGASTIGVLWSFGHFDDGYRIRVDVDTAGQGLVEGSDVKQRGIDIGHVDAIELRDGRALVTLFIDAGHDIPAETSTFTIRPKTLFGEKFVDVVPGPDEASGPYLGDGDEVPRFFAAGAPTPEGVLVDAEGRAMRSAGGFELEQVLMELHPILDAVDPGELATVLDELGTAGRGMGATINRSIVNGAAVLDVQAARDAEIRRTIEDLGLLAGELASRAPDVVAGAAAYNEALPVLVEGEDDLTALLGALESTSGELADLLESNTDFIDSIYSDGQAVLDTLHGRRHQLIPLVVGIRQYLETIGGAARIPVGDGTVMAAVKAVLGGEVCGLGACAPDLLPELLPSLPAAGPAPAPAPAPGPSGPGAIEVPGLPPIDLGVVQETLDATLDQLSGHGRSGSDAVLDILLGPLAPGGTSQGGGG